MFANTPKPPYYAVIFTSTLKVEDPEYDNMANLMVELASKQEGFLGIESARSDIGISVSYWRNLEAIKQWKAQTDHQVAQSKGKQQWYSHYITRISKVERDYQL